MSAAFPPSRHQSRIARERSRDVNNSMLSVASSTGSNHGTVSTDSTTSTDFDPVRDEACMSTQQFNANYSQKLPELRDTAKKYGRWQPQSQPEYVINTSAIGRAFPDFSQAGSSDDTFDVEVGRAPVHHQSNPRVEYSGSLSSPIITMGTTKILHTPKRTSANNSGLQDALHNRSSKDPAQTYIEQKENIPLVQVSAKASPYTSHASRTVRGERRSLAELHARVADESDGSFIGHERPAISTLQPPKNSRFSHGQTGNQQRISASPNVSSKRQPSEVDEAMVRAASRTPSKPQARAQVKPQQTNHSTASTQQSFLLPTTRGASDADPGSLANGVPVFQGRKAHDYPTFKDTLLNASFCPVDAIVIPDNDDEAIYELINQLIDRVTRVEAENTSQKQIISNMTKENNQLALEKKELEVYARPGSALGMGDGGSERHKEPRMEISKLQANIMSIQNQLDASEKRVSNQDMLLKTSATERDYSTKQLAEAYLEIERFQDENESWRQEREDLLQEVQRAQDQISVLAKANEALKQLQFENRSLKRENAVIKKSIQVESKSHEQVEIWQKNESLRQEIEDLLQELQQAQDQISLLKKGNEALEQLQFENKSLKRENEVLKKSVQAEAKTQDQVEIRQRNDAKLRNKLQRQEEVIRQLQEMTQEIHDNTREITHATIARHNGLASDNRSKSKPKSRRKSLPLGQSQDPISKVAKRSDQRANDADSVNASLGITSNRGWKTTRHDNTGHDDMDSDEEISNIHQAPAIDTLENLVDNDLSFGADSTRGTTTHKDTANRPEDDTFEGSSYASILGQGFMTTLRQHARALREVKEQQHRQISATAPTPNHTTQSPYPHSTHEPVGILKNTNNQHQDELTDCLSVKSAKSSFRNAEDLTGRLSVRSARSSKSLGHHENGHSSKSRRRHHSETSIHTSHRRRMETDEMTSAFIIPDLELGGQQTVKEHPKLTPEARQVLDGLCKHNTGNCTICRQIASFGDSNAATRTKQTVHIEKPIPVSERMPIRRPNEDEPTIRPSVLPGLALATVIKGLQDEIAHLKMKHAEIQTAYNQHDSSLRMRVRKTMKKQLDDLLAQIDLKSDQVYALYDVLEGQKQSGQEMSEVEVEKTLSNIGISYEGTDKEGEGEQGDDTLPWEGIEDD